MLNARRQLVALACTAIALLNLIFFSHTAEADPPDISEATELMVSRGTTIHIIDEWNSVVTSAADLPGLPMQWLPIGTKVVRFPRTEVTVFVGRSRKIAKAITETGLRGYVVSGDKNFFGEDEQHPKNMIAFLSRYFGTIAFITNNTKAVVRGLKDCTVDLWAGTFYKAIEARAKAETSPEKTIAVVELGARHRDLRCGGERVSKDKMIEVPTDKVRITNFPDELAKIDFYSRDRHKRNLRRKIVKRYIDRYWNSGLVWSPSIVKDCQSELTLTDTQKRQWEASFAAKLGFTGSWFDTSVGFASEITSLRDRVVTKQYGTGVELLQFHGVNLGRKKIHSIEFWSTEGCSNPSEKHKQKFASYRLPGQLSVNLSPEVFEEAGFQVHLASFRIQLLCHSQYSALKQVLSRKLGDGAIPYIDAILAKLSRVKFSTKSPNCNGGSPIF